MVFRSCVKAVGRGSLVVMIRRFLRLGAGAGFTKLGVHSAGRNRHDDGFHSANFLNGDPVFFGDAKVVLHSGIAGHGHG